jgi:hypothetical protein
MFSPSFCPKCGSPDLGQQLPPGDTHERLMCRGCGYIHYVNPKIIAGCIIEQDGSICCANAQSRRVRHLDATGGLHGSRRNHRAGGVARGLGGGAARKSFAVLDLQRAEDQRGVHHLPRHRPGNHRPVRAGNLDYKFFAPEDIPWDSIYYPAIRQILERYIEERQAGVYGIYIGNDDTGKITSFASALVEQAHSYSRSGTAEGVHPSNRHHPSTIITSARATPSRCPWPPDKDPTDNRPRPVG